MYCSHPGWLPVYAGEPRRQPGRRQRLRVAPCIRGGTPSDFRFPVHDVGLSPRRQGADATRVTFLSPVLARPEALPKSRRRSTSWGSPRCRARVAGRSSPALLTRRRSSKAMRMRSGWYAFMWVYPREGRGRRVTFLSPVLARPEALPKSRRRSTSWGSPRCRARVAGRSSPALLTRRRSSKAMRMRSGW